MTTCEVCEKNEAIGVASVPGVPYSAAYCNECLNANAHPYFIIVANTACIGGYDQANNQWKEMVDCTLKHLGKTMDEFNHDVKQQDHLIDEELIVVEDKRDFESEAINLIRENPSLKKLAEASQFDKNQLLAEISKSVDACLTEFFGRKIPFVFISMEENNLNFSHNIADKNSLAKILEEASEKLRSYNGEESFIYKH